MSTSTESQIQARIQAFVTELELLVRESTLQSLLSVLEGRPAPARRGRPAGSKRGPGRPRGGNVDDAAAKILAHVKANDGLGIGAIAAATRVALPLAKKAAMQMLASGALKKSGVRRGTVYHIGGGRKAGKRRTPKAKRVVRRAKKAPRRKARATKTLIPARRKAAPKAVAARAARTTDVPAALAVG